MTGQQYSVIIKTKYATTATLTSTAMKRNENGAAHAHTHTHRDALTLTHLSWIPVEKYQSSLQRWQKLRFTQDCCCLSLSPTFWNLRKCVNLLLKKSCFHFQFEISNRSSCKWSWALSNARQFCQREIRPRFRFRSEERYHKKRAKTQQQQKLQRKIAFKELHKIFLFWSLCLDRLQHPHIHTHNMLTKNVATTTTTGLRTEETATIKTTTTAMRIANTLEEIEDRAPGSHCPPPVIPSPLSAFPVNKLWSWRPPTRQELFVSGCLCSASMHVYVHMYVCVCVPHIWENLQKIGRSKEKKRQQNNFECACVRERQDGGLVAQQQQQREKKEEGEQKESSKSSSHYAEECAQVTIS